MFGRAGPAVKGPAAGFAMQMQWRANKDLWIELGVWLTLAAGAFYLSFSFDQPLDVYRFGAAAWPRALIAALAIGALVQFALTWYARRLIGLTVAQSYWARLKESGLAFSLKVGGTFAIPLLYRITSYNVCYTKLLRADRSATLCADRILSWPCSAQ